MHQIMGKNLWKYRYLLLLLVWRDVKARYKQAYFGISWAILTPIITALVFTLVFDVFLKISKGPIPYLLTFFTGYIFWNFLSQSISSATSSITGNSNLVTKVAFPKEILVLASILGRIPDFLASFLILLLLLVLYQINFSLYIIWIFPIIVLEFLLIYAIGLFSSAINVYFRDITAITPLVLMIWLYLTPVIYPLDSIPQKYRIFAMLNPLTGIIESFRRIILLKQSPDFAALAFSATITFSLLMLSYFVFIKLEKGFADII